MRYGIIRLDESLKRVVMPLYEYQCSQCGQRFEVLQQMGQGAEGLTCPDCGSERVAKQLSTFASGSGSSDFAAPAAGGCGPGGSGFS